MSWARRESKQDTGNGARRRTAWATGGAGRSGGAEAALVRLGEVLRRALVHLVRGRVRVLVDDVVDRLLDVDLQLRAGVSAACSFYDAEANVPWTASRTGRRPAREADELPG